MERVKPSLEELETALLTLNSKLGDRVEWAVDGSTSLKLQGKDIAPRDIDILTSRKGAEMIATLLGEYFEKPLRYGENEKYRSYFCVARLGRVKVMGDLHVFRKGRWTEVQNLCTARIRYVSRDLLSQLSQGASCFKGCWRNLHRLGFPSARRYSVFHTQPFDFTDAGTYGTICYPTTLTSVCQRTK